MVATRSLVPEVTGRPGVPGQCAPKLAAADRVVDDESAPLELAAPA